MIVKQLAARPRSRRLVRKPSEPTTKEVKAVKTSEERLRDLHQVVLKLQTQTRTLENQRNELIVELRFKPEYRMSLREIAGSAGMSHQGVKTIVDRYLESNGMKQKRRRKRTT